MKNDKERQRIVLAALLHDIGKFWQRADGRYNESQILKDTYPNKAWDLTVPLYDSGTPKYVHALWTNAFLVKTKTGVKLNLNFDEGRSLSNLSANHHKPNNHEEAIITLADRWSSGIDRPDEGEEGVSGYDQVKKLYGSDFVKKVAMHSIFDTIDRDYNEIKTHHTYPLKALTLSKEVLFPKAYDTNSKYEDYKKLWKDFYQEYIGLINKSEGFDAFYLSLLTLLKKYTWCIPSATNLLPSNVSLFEHLKSTAAIALSLYDYCIEHNETLRIIGKNIDNQPKDDPLLMVCVDVSGIQKFIYDIANKKAAASLKGRSFYIEILIQSAIDEIIGHKNIQAYRSNVIYSSGGKAYLILANTKKVKDSLEDVQIKLEQNLFSETYGQLFVSIGYTSFRYNSYYGELEGQNGKKGFINKLETSESNILARYETDDDTFNLSMLWRSVSDKAAERKNHKFKNIYLENFKEWFERGIDYDINAKKCAVTGEKIEGKGYTLEAVASVDGGKLYISEIVNQQIEMGRELRDADKITFVNGGSFNTANLGMSFHLKSTNHDDTRITYLNLWPDYSRHKGGQGHMFYGGNFQPAIEYYDKDSGEKMKRPKTFEELCKTNGGETTKLAILRMDVDNLGQIFITGIHNKSFASYATLSMMLDTFFAGYINTIQSSNTKYKEHVQVLYSGGDDVFAVGKWDAIIDFAADIRESFKEYVKRDNITISAGISIVHPKYPISKAAMDAGDAEKRAKDFIRSKDFERGRTKDAIDVFGETIGWGEEWREVDTLRKSFEYFENDIGRALIHNIQAYKVRKDENIQRLKRGEEQDLSYIWNSGYQLSRLMERLNKKQEACDFVRSLRDRILHDKKFGERFLDIAAIAARWAEYNLKDKSKDE